MQKLWQWINIRARSRWFSIKIFRIIINSYYVLWFLGLICYVVSCSLLFRWLLSLSQVHTGLGCFRLSLTAWSFPSLLTAFRLSKGQKLLHRLLAQNICYFIQKQCLPPQCVKQKGKKLIHQANLLCQWVSLWLLQSQTLGNLVMVEKSLRSFSSQKRSHEVSPHVTAFGKML